MASLPPKDSILPYKLTTLARQTPTQSQHPSSESSLVPKERLDFLFPLKIKCPTGWGGGTKTRFKDSQVVHHSAQLLPSEAS